MKRITFHVLIKLSHWLALTHFDEFRAYIRALRRLEYAIQKHSA